MSMSVSDVLEYSRKLGIQYARPTLYPFCTSKYIWTRGEDFVALCCFLQGFSC